MFKDEQDKSKQGQVIYPKCHKYHITDVGLKLGLILRRVVFLQH